MQEPSYFNQFPEHQILKCPRCDSSNTKFCYYNNYNLSQPRHYCKNCKRYWTKGGTLRNIPVGGASRKIAKRSSSNPKRAIPVQATTDTPQTTSAAPSESTNKSEQEKQHEQQEQQQQEQQRFLMANMYPRMSGSDPMSGFGAGEERLKIDAKVEETEETFVGLESGEMNCWSGGSNDWPDLAIYTTPGRSGFQ